MAAGFFPANDGFVAIFGRSDLAQLACYLRMAFGVRVVLRHRGVAWGRIDLRVRQALSELAVINDRKEFPNQRTLYKDKVTVDGVPADVVAEAFRRSSLQRGIGL